MKTRRYGERPEDHGGGGVLDFTDTGTVATWPKLTDEQKRQHDGCCVYGDCVEIGDHFLQGTDLHPGGPVFICKPHVLEVLGRQRVTG